MEEKNDAVLVVGAGIAGMAAGMLLAETGHPVYLLDAAPAIGGSMHLLDHTFPTNSCGICLMLPHQPALCPTFECDRHANVTLLPYTELTGLAGEPGSFTATLRHKARYVDPDRCNGCGDCAAVCPVGRPHDHEGWMAPVKAIYRPAGLRAVPDTWVVDMDYCTRCGACVNACPTRAIHLEMQAREEAITVGAVLLTPGFAPFDASKKGEYGYRAYDNVLTSLEFERMVSLAGSSVAHLSRPSDDKAPKRIAFIQCVGSRDQEIGAGHCSSACCMYTAKQIVLAKQIDPDLEITVFFMDLRPFGKDFEAYMDGVQALPGVTYRRAMPSIVYQLQQTRDLKTVYIGEDNKLHEEGFDLVVLAIGFAPPVGMRELASNLGVTLNDYGFAAADGYHPTGTNRPGVFAAGAFREPKDIPETVAEAAGAAADVAAFLQTANALDAAHSTGYAIRDVSNEKPRIGVFACECADLAPLDVPALVARTQDLPGVAVAKAVPDACSAEGHRAIQEAIETEGLNRVVVAACSSRLHADEFDAMMRDAGLDPRLLAHVNLREQVVYPHRDGGAGLDAKAHSLIAMAVAGLKTMTGVAALSLGTTQPLTRGAVVVGGGAAGLTAAVTLANLDVPVTLVEREPELGGQWRHIRYQADGTDPQAQLAALIDQVKAHEGIKVYLEAELQALQGGPGQYRSTVVRGSAEETVEHGVLVVATGGQPASITEYLYGEHPSVITQRELEQRLAKPKSQSPIPNPQSVVMIQCVGSREPERPYCSRVCCTQAVKNALKLKKRWPDLNVYVLYREVRTYGFREAYYQAARDAGVVFLRYELPNKPQVKAAGEGLRVELVEPVTGQPLELRADWLVLSVGIDAADESELATTLGGALDEAGFFQEEHPKMKPLDLGRGMFLAGLAHSPRFLEETIAQAQGAAMRAATYLAPQVLTDRPTAVWVNPRLCSFCGLCVEACPYEARAMNYDTCVADVNYALCQGCGVCAMVCPNKATLQKAFEHRQTMVVIDAALA